VSGVADNVFYSWQLSIEDLTALSAKHSEAQETENERHNEDHYFASEDFDDEDCASRDGIDQDLRNEMPEHAKYLSSHRPPLTSIEKNVNTFLFPSQSFANQVCTRTARYIA